MKCLGADDVIALGVKQADFEDVANEETQSQQDEQNTLFKELSIRKEYDYVFFTTATEYDKEFIRTFVSPKGVVVDAIEQPLASDNFGIFKIIFYSVI